MMSAMIIMVMTKKKKNTKKLVKAKKTPMQIKMTIVITIPVLTTVRAETETVRAETETVTVPVLSLSPVARLSISTMAEKN